MKHDNLLLSACCFILHLNLYAMDDSRSHVIELSQTSIEDRNRAYRVVFKELWQQVLEDHLMCPWQAAPELSELKEALGQNNTLSQPERRKYLEACDIILSIFPK